MTPGTGQWPGLRRLAWATLVVVAVAGGGCGGYGPVDPQPSPTPSSTPSPTLPGVVLGPSTGPTRIALIAADPAPGATVGGCGSDVAGCVGRIRLTFRVTPTANGTALFYRGFLHATDKTGCLIGNASGGGLRSGEPQTIEIAFDQPDTSGRCRLPLDLTDLAFGVEGTIEVASRQEWGLRYRLAP